jgi:hypothetical protein
MAVMFRPLIVVSVLTFFLPVVQQREPGRMTGPGSRLIGGRLRQRNAGSFRSADGHEH